MSRAYKECKREILNMLIIEKKLKKQLAEIQKEDSKTCKKWNDKKGFNDIDYDRDIKRFDFVLEKMNELEGDNNGIMD